LSRQIRTPRAVETCGANLNGLHHAHFTDKSSVDGERVISARKAPVAMSEHCDPKADKQQRCAKHDDGLAKAGRLAAFLPELARSVRVAA
jgi:hypothetical protein